MGSPGDRVEVTADFSPSSTVMIATGSLITGIVREMINWPSFRLEMLASGCARRAAC
jgi:hypothetical protein